MEYYPHGFFGLKFSLDPNYALITMSGMWNRQCVEVYSKYLKRWIFPRPDERRCAIFDCRDWGFQTPDCMVLIQGLNKYISEHYKEFGITYLLSPVNIHLGRRIIDAQYEALKPKMKLKYFSSIAESVHWLRDEGFDVPDLQSSDFPTALPAEEYLDDIEPNSDTTIED